MTPVDPACCRVFSSYDIQCSAQAANDGLDRRLRDASGIGDLGHGVARGLADVADQLVTGGPRGVKRFGSGADAVGGGPQAIEVGHAYRVPAERLP